MSELNNKIASDGIVKLTPSEFVRLASEEQQQFRPVTLKQRLCAIVYCDILGDHRMVIVMSDSKSGRGKLVCKRCGAVTQIYRDRTERYDRHGKLE